MTLEEMEQKYREVMGPMILSEPGLFIVRLWDGMDGCWCDCTTAVTKEAALKVWMEKTKDGTKKIAFSEIDYYKIFPAATSMLWDGSEGREMFRD
jgi:hypothetical protein